MAHRLKFSLNYATHMAGLVRAMARTSGPVLELGMGVTSTVYLHYECARQGRELVSYENNAGWAAIFADYDSPAHSVVVLDDWSKAHISRPWDVALIDHSPDEQRIVDIRRLAQHAKYIIAHDSDAKFDMVYHYATIYPLFKYRADWDGDYRKAVVLSNFVDLKGFWD